MKIILSKHNELPADIKEANIRKLELLVSKNEILSICQELNISTGIIYDK
jgi:hypothetical protein